MTSLYLALRSDKAVPTRTEKGKDIDRIYYLDIAACLDPEVDREDAVLSLPPDRVVRTNFNRDIALDLSTEEKEYEQAHFPLVALFDSARYSQWRRGYHRHHRHNDTKLDLFDDFEENVLDAIKRYRVPAIELTRGTSSSPSGPREGLRRSQHPVPNSTRPANLYLRRPWRPFRFRCGQAEARALVLVRGLRRALWRHHRDALRLRYRRRGRLDWRRLRPTFGSGAAAKKRMALKTGVSWQCIPSWGQSRGACWRGRRRRSDSAGRVGPGVSDLP